MMKRIILFLILLISCNFVLGANLTKEENQQFILDSFTDCIPGDNGLSLCTYNGSIPRYIQDEQKTWRNVTDVISFSSKNNEIIISCFDDEIIIEPYYKTDGTEIKTNSLKNDKNVTNSVNFYTEINKSDSSYYYIHKLKNSDKNNPKKITEFGYNLPEECNYNENEYSIICQMGCGDIRIDLSDAHFRQNLSVNKSKTKDKQVTFKGDDLSLIDPTITSANGTSFVTQDTFIFQYDPNLNYGTSLGLNIGPSHKGYTGIDFSEIYALNISNANLYVYFDYAYFGAWQVDVTNYCRPSAWFNELTLTWNNKGTYITGGSTTLNTWTSGQATGWKTVDITSCANGESGLNGDSKLVIEHLCTLGTNSAGWWSRQYTGNKPYITMTYSVDVSHPVITLNSVDGLIAEPYMTEDNTPSINFSTDENAWCRYSTSDYSYEDMSLNCQSGQNTTDHSCTVGPLSDGDNDIYIACTDKFNNSHSSADNLWVPITIVTSLESAIEQGIGNSIIWPGAQIYENQKVFLRNANNDVVVGTVDYAVIYGSQRWLINYDDSGTIGLFNITPSIYVLEMGNMSYVDILNEVEVFIDSTKN